MFNLRFFSSLLFCLFVHLLTFAQPANDDCSGAIDLTSSDKCIPINGSFNGATKSVTFNKYDIWYSFTATELNHYITVSGSDDYNGGIELFDGNTCSGLTSFSKQENLNTSLKAVFKGLNPKKYFFRVYNNSSNLPTVKDVSICVQNFMKNDECDGAIEVPVEYDYTPLLFSNLGGNASTTGCPPSVTTSDVWFKFKAKSDKHYIFISPTSSSSTFNAAFQVYSGNCSSKTSINCTNNLSSNKEESVLLTGLNKDEIYFLRVYDANTSTSDYYFNLSIVSVPENDNCDGAILLDGKSEKCTSYPGDGTYATETLISTSTLGNADDDVWYKFIADTSTYFISVNASEKYNPIVEVFESNCITKLPSPNSFNNDLSYSIDSYGTAKVSGLIKDKTYYYRVYDKSAKSTNILSFTTCVSKPPKNDNCLNAINIIPSTTCNEIFGESSYASQSIASNITGAFANDDVWYSFKPTNTSYSINVSPSFMYIPVIEFFNDCSTYSSKSIAASKVGENITLQVTGLDNSKTYYYRIFDSGNKSFQSMTFSTCVTAAPSNDDCVNAKLIYQKSSCDEVKSNGIYATKSINACIGNSEAADDDTWFKFIPTSSSAVISIKPDASKYDPVIEIFKGSCSTSSPTPVCIDNNFPIGKFGSTLLTGLSTSDYYYYRVYDKNDKKQDTMTFSTCVSNPIINDECLNAIELFSSIDCNPIVGDGSIATKSLNDCISNSDASNDDVWFYFTATKKDQFISVTPDDSNYDPVIEVFDGSCGTAMSPKICNDINFPKGKFGRLELRNLLIGKKYYYRVYDINSKNQDTMTFSTCVVESVSNDECSNPIELTASTECNETKGNTTYATSSQTGCTGNSIDDVWYKFKATTLNENIVITSENGFDPVIQVFKGGCGIPMPTPICEDTKFEINKFGFLTIPTVINENYYFRVYSKNSVKKYPSTFKICISHAPDNDNCASAKTVIPSTICNEVNSESTFATESLPGVCGGVANDDVWFKFTPTSSSHNLNISANENFDPVVQIFSNCSSTPTPFLNPTSSCNDTRFSKGGKGSWLLSGLNTSTTYYYRIFDKLNSSNEKLSISTCITPTPTPPLNDNPCSSTYIKPTQSTDFKSFTNEAASKTNSFLPTSCSQQPGNDVWFKSIAPFSGQLTIETKNGSMTDAIMSIYKGNCKSMIEIICIDDVSSKTMPSYDLKSLNQDDSIFIRIWEKTGTNNGFFGLSVKKGQEAPLVSGCANLDFETGTNSWFGTFAAKSQTGTSTGVITGKPGDSSPKYVPGILNTTSEPKQFELLNSGFDPYGGFNILKQGGNTLRLGYESVSFNNGRSIEQYFPVTANNNYFIYNYAAVLNSGGHDPEDQPFFKVEFFDDNGIPISCGDYLVAAPKNGAADKIGLSVSPKLANTKKVYYKEWTKIGVDLTSYIGKNIHVRFTAGTCGQTDHFGYAYIDCSCSKFEIEKPENVCLGDNAKLYAPKGALTYLWKDAGGTVISTADSAVFKTLITGKSTYTCEVTMFGTTMCKSILTTEIEVGNKPTLKITDPDTVCANNTVDITKSNVTLGSTAGLVYTYYQNDQTTPLTNQTAIDVSGTYYIKGEKSATCKDIKPVKVVISPTPKIADKTAIICSDDSVKLIPLLAATDVVPAKTKYKWTIDANSSNISGQATESIGKSDIKNKLSNKVNTAQKIKYKITPFTPTCEGTPFYFEITVNPKPQIKDSTSSICSNTLFNIAPVNLGPNVVPAGTTYTWIFKENTNVTNESNSATDESAIKSYTQNLINTTNTIQPVEHRVAPKSGTCVGDTFKIIIKVNPAPTIPDSLKSICTNTTFNTTPVHTGTRFIIPSGTTYTWTTPTLSGAIVGGSAQTNQTTISQTLINNTTTNQTAAYTITANSNTVPNCSSKFYDTITVEPKIKPDITCGNSSSTTVEFKWADIPGATSYEYVYKVGATGTLSYPPQSISAGISPRITSTTITGLSAANNVYFTLTPVGILCPLPETKICSNCAQPTIVNTVATTPTDFEICVGETITLKASEVPTNTSQWSIITNNIVSNIIQPSKDLMDITGLKAGTTDLEFENNTGCVNSITVTVNPKPEIAKIIKSLCYGGIFDTIPNNTILNTNIVPSGTTYTWPLPSTTVSNVTGITTSSSAETSFNQNLTNATNVAKIIDYVVTATSGIATNACSNDFDVSITLNPTPKITAINKILCSTNAFDTIPNNTSTNIVPLGTTYTWNLPTILTDINGATAETNNSSFKQTLTNTTNNAIAVNYNVTAKSGVSPNQCLSTFNTTLTVNPTPKIDNITLKICSEETFDTIPNNTILNTNIIPSGTTYTWSLPTTLTGINGASAENTNTKSSIKQTLKNTTANPIDVIYTIKATSGVIPNQCSKPFTLTVTVNPIPKIITVDTIKICENIKTFNQFNLNETSGIASSWEWSSNLTSSTATIYNKTSKNPTVKNGINGEEFKVVGTDAKGCKNSDTTTLKINPIPIIKPKEVCVDKSIVLTASNIPATSNAWKSDDLSIATIDPITGEMKGISSGKSIIIYTDDKGCTDTSKMNINALPKITTTPLEVCEESTLQLKADHAANSVNAWTTSKPNFATISNTGLVQGIKTGESSIEFTDSKGCTTKEDLAVNIKPIANFKAMYESICVTDTLFLIDKSKPLSHKYIWSFGDGLSSNQIAHKYLIGGIFDITLVTITDKGCMDTMTKNKYIEVIGLPKVTFSFTPDSIDIFEPEIRFMNHSDAKHYKWVFGDGLPTSVQENPTHTFPTTTGQHYTVTLTGYNTQNGCSTSYSQIIVAKEPLIYYIPNTFTPNGDEYNNVFKPIFYSGLDIYNYHFTIYNRWGEVVFESFNVDFGWDGTYGNQIEETATYIWKLEFKEKNKENTHSKTGHVNVIK